MYAYVMLDQIWNVWKFADEVDDLESMQYLFANLKKDNHKNFMNIFIFIAFFELKISGMTYHRP
jgi:hypothetical protein